MTTPRNIAGYMLLSQYPDGSDDVEQGLGWALHTNDVYATPQACVAVMEDELREQRELQPDHDYTLDADEAFSHGLQWEAQIANDDDVAVRFRIVTVYFNDSQTSLPTDYYGAVEHVQAAVRRLLTVIDRMQGTTSRMRWLFEAVRLFETAVMAANRAYFDSGRNLCPTGDDHDAFKADADRAKAAE